MAAMVAAPARAPPPALLWRPAAARTARRVLPPPGAAGGVMGGLYDMATALNAEALARKEGGLVGAERGMKPLTAVQLSLLEQPSKAEACAEVLERQGCLGVRGVLSAGTAAELRAFIEEENARCQADVEAGRVEFDARFGGVNCRGIRGRFGQRQDLFLPLAAPPVQRAVAELASNLAPLLVAACGPDAALHELSCFVAQPGAPRQCVHADTIVLPCPQYPDASMAPLYTFFVALQDVEDSMGHTQFLPYTHTPDAHLMWNTAARSGTLKEKFISMQPAMQSALTLGDAAIFDSRLLHCGCANTSQKTRIIFYVTFSSQAEWPLPDGLHGSNSVRAEDLRRWKLPDLLAMAAEQNDSAANAKTRATSAVALVPASRPPLELGGGPSSAHSGPNGRRAAAMKGVLLLALVLSVFSTGLRHHAGAASGRDDGVIRIAVLSDTHLSGPEYPLGTENGPLDNASITKTQQRLWRAVRAVNAMVPAPRLLLFGGDVVHNSMEHLRALGLDAAGLKALLEEPINGYKVAQAILSELNMPQLYVWGNHDNLVECGDPARSPSKAMAAEVYQHFFGAKPYDSRDLGPWKVVALNSMYGHTWDPASERCNSVLSSFGAEQLRWLDAELGQRKHTLVMVHHPLPTSVVQEVDTQQAWRDLRTVLSAHSNVQLVLSGHFHKGISWEGLFPFPAHTLPATRYSPQNYFAFDLHPDGTVEAADAGKNRAGSRCSDAWSYGTSSEEAALSGGSMSARGHPLPEGELQPRDEGDCGIPAAGAEAAFPLPLVLNKSMIPSQDVFNPERSCQWVLARPFMQACVQGATQDCCEVIADQFRPSSSAPFSTCLCQPSFWKAAVDYMGSRHGVDLPATLSSCISERRKLILYRGGPLTWCPAARAEQGPPGSLVAGSRAGLSAS